MKKYFICNNRDATYCIMTDNKNVWVYCTVTKKLIFQLKNIIKFFAGISTNNDNPDVFGPEYNGNSVLIKCEPMLYVYIGHNIMKFKTKEPVIKYISNIGNNLVPYPYAVTKKNTYLILEQKIIPNHILDAQIGPYTYYYSFKFSLDKNKINPFPSFKTKILKKNINLHYPMYYYIIHPNKIDNTMEYERCIYLFFKQFKPIVS
jgi:hypothetical protein